MAVTDGEAAGTTQLFATLLLPAASVFSNRSFGVDGKRDDKMHGVKPLPS